MKREIVLVIIAFLGFFLVEAKDPRAPAPVAYAIPLNANSTNSTKCNKPAASTVEPDKCCKFPDLFADSMVEQCEKDFTLNSTAVNNEMLADSCIVECVFNKSGLNKQSKIVQEDLVKVLTTNAKNDAIWTPLITKAVDTCYKDLDPSAIDDYINSSMNETISKLKIPTNKLCHPISGLILDCIYFELFKGCPKDKFNSTVPACNDLKAYATDCEDW